MSRLCVLSLCFAAATSAPAWKRFVPPSPPLGRANSIATVNSTHIVVAGGRTGDALDQVPGDLVIDVLSGSMTQSPTASLGVTQAAIADVPENANANVGPYKAFAFLGLNEDGSEAPASRIWVFQEGVGWFARQANGTTFPRPRRGAQAIFLRECRAGRNCFIIYGGIGATTVNTVTDSCWIFFPATGTYQVCTQSGPAPPAAGGIIGHTLAASGDGLSFYVYGGMLLGSNTVSSDVYQMKVNGYSDADATQAEMRSLATGSPLMLTAGSSSAFRASPTTATAAETKVVTDGSVSQTYTPATGAGCFVTFVDPVTNVGTKDPWWRVDLGQPNYAAFADANIFLLRAYMRTDAFTNRNQGVSFWVSNVTSPLPWEGGGVQWPNPYTDPIYSPNVLWAPGWPKAPRPINGRYVWAANLGGNKVLQICELQVYQPVYWRWRQLSGATNLALGKRAYQVAMDPGFAYGDPLNAVDGITGTITRTPGGVRDVWWYVDLGETYDVSYVSVLDGASSNYWRANASEVVLGDSADPWSPSNFRCAGPVTLSCFMMNDPAYKHLSHPDCVTPSGPVNFMQCTGPSRYVIIRKQEALSWTVNLAALPPVRQCQFYPSGTGCPSWCAPLGSTCGGAGIRDMAMIVLAEVGVWGNKLRYEPVGRFGAASAQYGSYIVIFGGQDANGFLLNDLRLFNMQTGKWEPPEKPLGTPPAARTGATFTLASGGIPNIWLTDGYFPARNELYLFGGVGTSQTYNDLSVLTWPACPALNLGAEPGIESMSCWNRATVCTYTCFPGFKSNGDQVSGIPASAYYGAIRGVVTCRQDGTWDAYFPLCVPDPAFPNMLPAPPSLLFNPPVVDSSGPFSSALTFKWQRPVNAGAGNANGPSAYRVRSVPKFWNQRFYGQPLDAAWTLRNGPPFSSLTGTYSIDTDGLLAIDAPVNGECKFAQQDCTMLTRPFPQGPGLPNLATESWSLEAHVSYQFFTSRVPTADNMIGIGLFDTSTPITVPDPRNATRTISFTGALHFMANIKRFCSPSCQTQGGWEALNAATGFSFVYASAADTVEGIVGSPWAYIRIDRSVDESVLSDWNGVVRPGFGAWRVCVRYDPLVPYPCGLWYTDNTFLRANATGTRVFNPATAQIALYARSRTSSRAYGRIHYVRFGPLQCDIPGPVLEVAATTQGSPLAQQNVTTVPVYASGSKMLFTIQSGGTLGFGPVSAPTTVLTLPPATSSWNSTELIEVARNKRSGQFAICPNSGRFASSCPAGTNGQLYGPRFGNDGVIDVTSISGSFVFVPRNFDGSWWFVDLGIPTAVKEIALYNRFDGSQNRLDNFKIILTQLEDRNSGTECDPSQLPMSLGAAATYNGKPFAARFKCSAPTGLVGRYVFLLNRAGEPLNFREMEVFGTNYCGMSRTAVGPSVQVPGTVCGAGAAYGAVCVHQCLPGFIQQSGSASSTCNGDTWNDPPLVCAPACPLLPAPERAAVCRQSVYKSNFNDPRAVSASWVSLMESFPSLGPYVFAANDGLQISAGTGCTAGIVAQVTSTKVLNWKQGLRVTTRVRTDDRAGVVWRAQDVNNFYRVYLDAVSQVHTVERMRAGRLTTLVTSSTVTVRPDTWCTLSVYVDVSGKATITVDGILLVEVTDAYLSTGSVGVAAAAYGQFDDFTVDVACESCDNSLAQDTCTYECAPGLKAVGVTDVGNPYVGTRTCVSTGATTVRWSPDTAANGGFDMVCTLDPPFFPAATLRVVENSPRNALVDNPLTATITSPDYTVIFAIKGGNVNNIFMIDSCSGQVKVRTPLLDFETRSVYTLQVSASVDGFPDAVTTQNITVSVINVNEAPVVTPATFVLRENAPPGTIVGVIPVRDPELDSVEVSVEVDGAGGRFAVNLDGTVVVSASGGAPNALDFEAVGSWPFSLVVRAKETTALGVPTAAGLASTGRIMINLQDRNDAPTVSPGLLLSTTEVAVNAGGGGSTGASLTAVDQDNTAGGNFSAPLTFTLVDPQVADVTAPACAAALTATPPFFRPTRDGSTGTPAMFSVHPASGLVSVANAATAQMDTFTPFGYNSQAVRAVYVLCVNVSDAFGGWTALPALLAVVADISAIPAAFAIDSPAGGLLPTTGGPVTVSGMNFGPSSGVAARATVAYAVDPVSRRRVNLTSCVPSNDTVTCLMPPASGAGYRLFIEQSLTGGPVLTAAVQPTPLYVGYLPPVVTGVSVMGGNVSSLATCCASNVSFVGTNFGSFGMDDAVRVWLRDGQTGPSAVMLDCVVLPAVSSHTRMSCMLPPFHSVGWAWTLSVGGQEYTSTPEQSVGYEAPVITSVLAVQGTCPGTLCVAGAFSLTNLSTAGGETVKIVGSGFGPSDVAPPLTGTYGPITFTQCRHEVEGLGLGPSKTAYCVTAAAVGKSLGVILTVGNQRTTPAFGALAYSVPVITSATTSAPMDTEGGAVISIRGSHFGPPQTPVDYFTYGPASNVAQYNGVGCRVLDSRHMECESAPGVGAGLSAQLSIGNQPAEPRLVSLSYMPPSVYSFAGVGAANAVTQGGQQVVITGRNFGPGDTYTNAQLRVVYGVALQNGPVNITKLRFHAASCAIDGNGHTTLRCDTAEGAGRALAWTVTVAGQDSVQPTTSYAVPVVHNIALLDRQRNGVPVADVNGGTLAVLTGENFGPTSYNGTGLPLVQAISYGVNGGEYSAPPGSWTVISHTELHVPLLPGAGKGLRIRVSVADQTSLPSSTTFDFATPAIVGLTPPTADTASDPRNPTTIVAAVKNLPLQDTSSKIGLLFGGRPLTPQLPVGVQALALATNADGSVNVAFNLPPAGAGMEIPVLFTVTSTSTGGEVDRSPVTSTALFSYNDPAVLSVVVTRAKFTTNGTAEGSENTDAIKCPFDGFPAWDCASPALYQITLYGRNFGVCPARDGVCPPAGAADDAVAKAVIFLHTNYSAEAGLTGTLGYGELWCDMACVQEAFTTPLPVSVTQRLVGVQSVWVQQWSHTKVVLFAKTKAATMKLRLTSTTAGGAVARQEVLREFTQASPEVSAVSGGTRNVPTAGGTLPIVLEVYNMAQDNRAEVLVGGNVAPLILSGCGGVPTQASVRDFINWQIVNKPPGAPTVLCATVPAGQGKIAPIQVIRIDGSSGTREGSNTGLYVSYLPPTLSTVEVQDDGAAAPRVYRVSFLSTVAVPTKGSSIVRFRGANLGAAPTVYMGDYKVSGGLRNVTECAGTVGTHVCYEARSVPGEGTGKVWEEDYGATEGYQVFLEAGDQDSARIRFSYLPPLVDSVSPTTPGAPLSTQGGVPVRIFGSNFGERVGYRPDSTLAVQFFLPDAGVTSEQKLECGDVRRVSHVELTCVLPEGSGKALSVLVRVSDVNGTSAGRLSYALPTLTVVTLLPMKTAMVMANATDAAGVATYFSAGAWSAATSTIPAGVVSGAPSPTLPLLADHTQGGAVLVLEGSNFGAFNPDAHCVFFTWSFRSPHPSRVHRCNNGEDFLGEGEVHARHILAWTHGRVTMVVPPGLGTKDVEMSIRGSMLLDTVPRSSPSTLRFKYLPPMITHVSIGRTGCTVAPGTGVVTCATPVPLAGTDGGDVVTVNGENLGPSPRNTSTTALRLPDQVAPWTVPVPLDQAPGLPTATLVLSFHRSCLSLAKSVDGFPQALPFRPWYTDSSVALSACDGERLSGITHSTLTFAAMPGIGKERKLQAFVVEDASAYPAALQVLPIADPLAPAATYQVPGNVTLFSYRPPSIDRFDPSTLVLQPTEEDPSQDVDMFGANFGNDEDADRQGWTAGEREVLGSVGGINCLAVTRRRQFGMTVLTCKVPASRMQAGYRNVTVTTAGQTGFAGAVPSALAPSSDVAMGAPALATSMLAYIPLLLVCGTGFYGRVNETCLPCPAQYGSTVGAICAGYSYRTEQFEARFTYPRPVKGWYNLNSSDVYTRRVEGAPSMMPACPAGFQDKGRDVCIVPCDPPESCLGDNLCAEGYTSKPPMWRCASCDKGFYKRAGECIKCPDSPGALFIGFILLVIVVAGVGFALNRKQINIAVISIGVDFFQVLAIFAQARVKWPPVVKELLHVLSAFNLNIEIVAPECLIPDVSYKQKFWFIMILPLAIGSLFGLNYLALVAYKALILGQPKKTWHTHRPALVSSALVLVYLLYLYLTRTILDVFNCGPTFPPDGKNYLQVVFEECGIPGGTQLTLLPFAVAGLVVYTAGYPMFIGYTIWTNREIVMEDQLLRAKGTGADKLTNPRAHEFRLQYGRAYFQFKPDFCMWILAIVLRKFFIAITAVVFGKNSSFQMAACLLIMFLAYAAQVQIRPYMSPGDFDEVVKSHVERSYTSAIHARLRASLAGIESRGRKKGHKNLINFEGKVDRAAVFGVLTGFFFNYNTVEAIMQFCAVIVCLMAIMYQANEVNSYYPESRDSITSVTLIIIIWAIVYFFTVFITEIVVLYNEDARTKQLSKAARTGKGGAGGKKGGEGEEEDAKARSGKAGRLVDDQGDMNLGHVESATNPMFLKSDSGAAALSTNDVSSMIMLTRESPPTEVWRVFQTSFTEQHEQINALKEQVAHFKKAAQTGAGLAREEPAVSAPGARARTQFAPRGSADAVAATANPLLSTAAKGGVSMAAMRKSARAAAAAESP